MARKKRGLAAFRRKANKTRRARARSNPPSSGGIADEVKTTIAPAVGAYLASRVLSRVVYTLVQRRSPRFGKHAAAMASLAGFAGAYWGAPKVGALAPYQGAIAAGAGVATAHTLFTTYLPKYGWLMADPKPTDVAPKQIAAPQSQGDYMTLEDELEAEAEAAANRAIGNADVVRESLRQASAAAASQAPQQATGAMDDEEDDFSDILSDESFDWGNEAAWQN